MVDLLDSAQNGPGGPSGAWQLPAVDDPDDDVILIALTQSNPATALDLPAGWAIDAEVTGGIGIRYAMSSRQVGGASGPYEDTFEVAAGTADWSAVQLAFRSAGASLLDAAAAHNAFTAPFPTDPTVAVSVSPQAGAVLVGYVSLNTDTGAVITGFAWPPGWIVVESVGGVPTIGRFEVAYRVADGTETSVAVDVLSTKVSAVVLLVGEYDAVTPFTAEFTSNTRTGPLPLSVAFVDESFGGSGTPDTWLWDFGDGATSTLQNPTHVYTTPGNYTVTLTVTTDDDETDTEVKTAFVVAGDAYVPPDQSLAVIEIRAASPGSARWGRAHWGVDVWATAGWQDVTPQSIDATVRWGSHSPEFGILAETEAATWLVNTYDPERLLDPGNPDGPYAADLRAGLPIRIRHRGTIVRQGVCETIAFFHKDTRGGIRVTDNLSLMARTPVPADSELADTLRARARDAIASAGLALTVEPDPPSGDPALAPRIEGDRSVWRHISDAAQQTLHIAYIDRIGTVKFRPWATPYDRGRGVDETQLVDLGTIVQTRGLYSVVQAQQTVGDGGLLLERRLTPTPRYGSVTYSRTEETPDADAWADAVLADRGLQGVQWIPGEIFPLDANAVEYFATLESVERFGVQHANTDPIVSVHGIIIGGEFRVTSKRDDSALWSFELELAQTASTPLYTDTDPAEFLLNDFGDGYLYPG